jgi:luciferase family oxidoreductase group 1
MLPNHSPLVIAEQFGTLESLYPGRIDLGLGRAPGTDQMTWRALRRDPQSAERFPQDVMELQALLGPAQPGQTIHAVPGTNTNVPLWILGSSLFGAQLAAHMGLPFAFASHFAPDAIEEALAIYRARFKPSAQLDRPYAMVGVNVVAADTDAEAQWLFTSVQQAFIGVIRNARTQLPPPVDDMDALWSPAEKAYVRKMLRFGFAGSADTVRAQVAETIALTQADEIMATSMIYDHEARLHSYAVLATAMKGL